MAPAGLRPAALVIGLWLQGLRAEDLVADVKPLALGFVIGTVGSALVWIWAMTAEDEQEDWEP